MKLLIFPLDLINAPRDNYEPYVMDVCHGGLLIAKVLY
jgi:hypothetical protein